MTFATQSALERLLRDCELGWMIDWYAPPSEALPVLKATLEQATQESQRRFGEQAPRFTEEMLASEYASNPHKVKAFLQALGTTHSPHMLVMAWRVIHGATIAKVHVSYEARQAFQMQVELENPYDQAVDQYDSTDINDAAILRHFGIASLDGSPLFDGFYPLRIT